MNIGYRISSKKIDAELQERTIDLRQYLNFVWRNWMFIVSVTAFAFLFGLIYLVRATPLYTAATQVLLEQREKPPGLDAIINDGGVGSDYYLEYQLAILRPDSLLRRVAIKELAPPSARESDTAAQSKEDQESAEAGIRDSINRLRGALGVSRGGRAQIVNIAITWEDPIRAGQLANA